MSFFSFIYVMDHIDWFVDIELALHPRNKSYDTGIMTWAKIKSQMLKRLNHLGALKRNIF